MRASLLWWVAALAPLAAHADQVIPLDGTITRGGLDHLRVPFDVPAGVAELQVDHDDGSPDDILDWGLDDPAGWRGWGGGNTEPVVITASAASRSYLAGPITPGRWSVVIGKAKLTREAVDYRLTVTLRDRATLAPQPERRPYAPAAPLLRERRWYAGDLHVHTRESGDASPTLDEVATFAEAQGLDFVELSDHNTRSQLDLATDAQARHPRLLLLPGVELTTYAGHANGIGATAWVDHKIGQVGVTIEAVAAGFHAQGALFSINHPKLDVGELCIGCAWRHALAAEHIDAVEIATAGAGALFIESTLAWWDELCATGRHVAAVGGSDDHGAGQRLGPFGAPIGTPATYVWAEALSAEAIVAGIRAGRTVVKLLGPSDPMIELDADAPLDGDTVRAARATLRARVTGGAGLTARWVVDGVAGRPEPIGGDDVTLTRAEVPPASGQRRYRVEVLRSGLPTTVTSHLWLERAAGDATDGGCGCATARDDATASGLLGLWACALPVLCAWGARRARPRR